MTQGGKLRAWIQQHPEGKFLAGFVGVVVAPDGGIADTSRAPATLVCQSPEEGREWIEDEAVAFGLPVEWVETVAGGH